MNFVNGLERSIADQLEAHGFATRAGRSSEGDIVTTVPTADGDREIFVQVQATSRPSPRPRSSSEPGASAPHQQLHPASQVTMLAEPYISARRGQALRARDVPYVDTVGNMWLQLPGLYILIEGRLAPPKIPKAELGDRLSRPSSLRIIFALLTQPWLVQATLRELSEQCGTSVGAAQAATADLTENGYLSGKSESRRLMRTGVLADRWVFDYGTRLLPKLEQSTFRGPSPSWWVESSHLLPPGAASIGGETACELLGYPLRAVETLLYGRPPWGSIRKLGRLASEGVATVTLRERFWSPQNDASISAPSLLIYADLALHDNPRLKEMSRQMRRDDDDLRRLWPI